MITVKIIADSVNSVNNSRLTTFVLEFPRWILAELNTHRMFSRNVASSRAIPIEKMIEMVMSNPAVPSFYGKNQPGMQSDEELSGKELELAKSAWLDARNRAVQSAKELSSLGLHKQYVNRTIENFMYVRAIVSATEIQNFFALRAHKDAQPEIRVLAEKMLDLYNKSNPQILKPGEWHIPFGDKLDEEKLILSNKERYNKELEKVGNPHFHNAWENSLIQKLVEEDKKKIAIARCARVSYFNFEGKDDYAADIKLCDRLFGSIPRHLSPTEHVAQAVESGDFIANFRGFKQYRKFFEDENLKDNRIINKI